MTHEVALGPVPVRRPGLRRAAPERLRSAPPLERYAGNQRTLARARAGPDVLRCAGGGCDCAPEAGGLTVSLPNDPAEHEAERVADEVMRSPDPNPPRSNPPDRTPASAGHNLGREIDEAIGRGGGRLPSTAAAFLEDSFGPAVDAVRVHTDERAGELAHRLGARAFTTGGNHVFFAPGEYQPAASSGLRLLAHELTHVVQQGGDAAGAAAMPAVHRACGEPQISAAVKGRITPIELGDPGLTGTTIHFRVGCDEFLTDADEGAVRALARGLPPRGRVVLHGFASDEGEPMFNLLLSQARAEKVKDILTGLLDPAQVERVVMHGGVPGAHRERRAVVIQTRDALPVVTRRLDIVSWINGAGLPDFSKTDLALDPPSIRVIEAACMALKCTANPPPPSSLPPSAMLGFLGTKQYRAVQSYELLVRPGSTPPARLTSEQIVGYTAPSSCPAIPPSTFRPGEVSPLNHVTSHLAGRDPGAEALMKFRVSAAEEADALAAATSFPGSVLFSLRMLRHVPWVWTRAAMRLDASTGLLHWQVDASAFPTHTVYLDGVRVGQINQGVCGVVIADRFRTADQPRQTMAEEAKQAAVPITSQDETMDPGGSASGSG